MEDFTATALWVWVSVLTALVMLITTDPSPSFLMQAVADRAVIIPALTSAVADPQPPADTLVMVNMWRTKV
jgi:hypothetical protein